MQTRIRERPVPAVAGSLAVLGGVALWQLGIEFERAWMRSYDGPLLGETLPGTGGAVPQLTAIDQSTAGLGGRRRWVRAHHPRGSTRERNGASASNS
jgi:hypothetical protein